MGEDNHGVMNEIEKLLKYGYKPADIVRMGYPKSTVYTVFRRLADKYTKLVRECKSILLKLMNDGECIVIDNNHALCRTGYMIDVFIRLHSYEKPLKSKKVITNA